MIELAPELGFWNHFTFWYVVINAIVTAVFLVVVIIGGLMDLRVLFKGLRDAVEDVTDDGRVVRKPAEELDPSDRSEVDAS